MTTRSNTTGTLACNKKADRSRPLRIDFDLYTGGEEEYKQELVLAILANLKEFQQALLSSISQNNALPFCKACHKMKVTLNMLDDVEFSGIVEELEEIIGNDSAHNRFVTLSDQFQEMCAKIICSLAIETGLKK